jgi:hypothetical protein
MSGSTRLLQWLKILSVGGLAVNAAAFIIMLIFALLQSKSMAHDELWIFLWATFSVGLPAYGSLYVLVKAREYLRDIEATLMKK